MNPWFYWALIASLFMLLAAMGCSVLRLLKGPHAQDRVLALDCMYLNGMLVMLVMGICMTAPTTLRPPCWWPCLAAWAQRPWPSSCCVAR